MSIPHKCPVCEGKGIVPGGFYTSTGPGAVSGSTTEACRSCNSTGIIWGGFYYIPTNGTQINVYTQEEIDEFHKQEMENRHTNCSCLICVPDKPRT